LAPEPAPETETPSEAVSEAVAPQADEVWLEGTGLGDDAAEPDPTPEPGPLLDPEVPSEEADETPEAAEEPPPKRKRRKISFV
jgi:hypothetical protein